MQVVVIINSFQRRELLAEAVESLLRGLASSAIEYALVVFDAGSTDGSREWLAQFEAANRQVRMEVILASPAEDRSFAAGVNRACQLALEEFPDVQFLFLYETDNRLCGVEPLRAAMRLLEEEPKLAAAGFTVRRHCGSPAGWGEAFPTVFSFMLGPQISHRLAIPRFRPEIRQSQELRWFTADAVYTSPLLIRSSAWRHAGGLDAEWFPFSDCDLDWAWRTAKNGGSMAVVLTNQVVHDNCSSFSPWSSLRVLNFHQGRFRLLRKHRGTAVVAAIPVLFVRHVLELVLLAAMVLAGQRTAPSIKKRLWLMKHVWRGYESI